MKRPRSRLHPTSDDLLSQSLLESLAVGTPVLANASNEAAVEHCRRANAGLYYSNREEFVGALTELRRRRFESAWVRTAAATSGITINGMPSSGASNVWLEGCAAPQLGTLTCSYPGQLRRGKRSRS